jgi:hypothetical protein
MTYQSGRHELPNRRAKYARAAGFAAVVGLIGLFRASVPNMRAEAEAAGLRADLLDSATTLKYTRIGNRSALRFTMDSTNYFVGHRDNAYSVPPNVVSRFSGLVLSTGHRDLNDDGVEDLVLQIKAQAGNKRGEAIAPKLPACIAFTNLGEQFYGKPAECTAERKVSRFAQH